MIVATPHVSTSYPATRAEGIAAALQTLQLEADAAGIDVRLVSGAEIALVHCETLPGNDLAELCLGASPYKLVELPFTATPQFTELLLALHNVHPAVLAHPERCRAFHDDDELLGRLVEQGMLAQVTAGSIAGSYGSTVQRCAWRMLEQGLVHVVASDAHDAVRRPPLLREPLEEAGLGELVAHLCEAAPAAILAGERPAPAPPVAVPRSVRRRRRSIGLRRK